MSSSKRFLVVLASVAFVAFCGSAFAATSGSLVLSGSVPAILSISVSGNAAASNLPVTTNVSDLPVATVVELSNKKAGYTVSLQSASALASGGSSPSLESVESLDILPYVLKYDGTVVSFSSGSAVVANVSSRTGMSGTSRSVTVSFNGASHFLDESTYSDTLTFTIAAK